MSFKNKRAVLGGFLGMFVATIAVVLILLFFVLFSGAFKMFGDSELKVESGAEIGIGNLVLYFENFAKLTQVRFLVEQGRDLEDAIKEVKYDE